MSNRDMKSTELYMQFDCTEGQPNRKIAPFIKETTRVIEKNFPPNSVQNIDNLKNSFGRYVQGTWRTES